MITYKPSILYFVSFFIAFIFFRSILTDTNLENEKFSKFYPADYEMIKRTFPHYNYDKRAYKDALEELQVIKKESRLQKLLEQKLEFVGPINIGGRIVDIEFNPKTSNIVYAAAATGGVFKSTDTGKNWFPIFDDQPSLTIGDIGIDPINPNIIYVGTGEANGGHNNFPGTGLFKSENGGESWNFIGLDSSVAIARILVDPINTNRVFVAAVGSYFEPNSQRGVFLSEDAGQTWKKSLFVSDSTGAIDLVMDESNPNTLYAAMWERVRRPVFRSGTHLYGPSGGIYKSTDGGETWKKLGIANGLPDPSVNRIGRIGLTISRSNPQILYTTFNNGSTLYGIYKTTDGGENWNQTNDSFDGASNFSWYFGQVRVHPTNPNTVYVLDVSFIKSTNSGISWDFSYGYGFMSDILHVDHHALAFHPNNPMYLLSGNDGGINISEDGGLSWSEPVNLPVTQFYEIGLDNNFPERFYGGTQDNNTIRTLTGESDDWESIYGGDGFYVIVHPENPDIIYAESQFGYLGKSTDGGDDFFVALNGIDGDEPTNWSTPVVMDPNNANILYYGTHSLYRTVNGAQSWTKISPQLTDWEPGRRLGTLTTISVAPTNSDVIYVGTDDGNIWISSDLGATWENISAELPFRWVTRVAADPNDENIVYATFSGLKWADSEPRVFRSENKGTTWQNISAGLPDAPVNAIAINPNNSDNIFVGNDVGAFISFNSGDSWDLLSNDFPVVIVNDMKIHPSGDYLAIGTHGRGIYRYDLGQVSTTKSEPRILPNEFSLGQNYPNPFNPTTEISYTINSVSNKFNSELTPYPTKNKGLDVKLTVYDILGRKIKTLVNKFHENGKYKVLFDASELGTGTYYYRLETSNKNITKKMILIK